MVQQRFLQSCIGVLFDKYSGVPPDLFDGYALIGPDVILGVGGHQRYVDTRQRRINSGEDGTYICSFKDGPSTRIGVDFAGNYSIFLYRHLDYWAFSNSFVRLVEHVGAVGKPLTINQSRLDAWIIPRPLFRQPYSRDTLIEEIEIVPIGVDLLLNGCGLALIGRRKHSATGDNYSERLSNAMSVALSRITTLVMSKDRSFVVDLTGGLDSRTVLSHFSHLAECGLLDAATLSESLHTSIPAGGSRDGEVAGLIRNHIGLTKKLRTSFLGSSHGDVGSALEQWRSRLLGLHGQFTTFPTLRGSQSRVRFSGGGGGNYRHFYRRSTPLQEFRTVRYDFPRQSSAFAFLKDYSGAANWLAEEYKGLDFTISHYREFRSRFHFGTMTHVGYCIHLISGRAYADAFDLMPSRGRVTLFYDVIASLDERLLEVEFDNSEKDLSHSEVGRIVRVAPGPIEQGELFYGSNPGALNDELQGGIGQAEMFSLLRSRFELSIPLIRDQSISSSYISRGLRALDSGVRLGRLSKSQNASVVHYSELLLLLDGLGLLRPQTRSVFDRVISRV